MPEVGHDIQPSVLFLQFLLQKKCFERLVNSVILIHRFMIKATQTGNGRVYFYNESSARAPFSFCGTNQLPFLSIKVSAQSFIVGLLLLSRLLAEIHAVLATYVTTGDLDLTT